MTDGAVIAVSPDCELEARSRLFRALEQATGARVVPASATDGTRIDGAVCFEPRSEPNGVRTLVVAPGEGAAAGSDRIRLGYDIALDRRLRGRGLRDGEAIGVGTLAAERGDTVLARVEDGSPLWVRRGLVDRAALVPRELETGEGLRDAFIDSRFLALLPLVHLFREVEPEPRWRRPPLRASFVFDDPNLRRPSYGFVRFPELARHAERHGYHATMATIPLDGRGASRRAAAFFRGRDAPLSLVVHGNDHLSRELGRSVSDSQALAIAAQAWRRIESLERRVDLPVARIMVPPHGALSEAVARALLRTGYDAACVSRPYPWLEHPPADRPLAGWHPAEIVVGGLPLLPRFRLRSRADLALRAFLGQPLVPYGHSEDLAEGYDLLADIAKDVDETGDVRWTSLDEIARTNYATRRAGGVLHVRLFSRRARIDVTPDVSAVVVELPHTADGLDRVAIADRSGRDLVSLGEPVAIGSGRVLDVRLIRPDAVAPGSVPAPVRRSWPVLRRVLTESRDRALPRLPAATQRRLRRVANEGG